MEWLQIVQAITVSHQLGAFGHKGPFGFAIVLLSVSLLWLILVQTADSSESCPLPAGRAVTLLQKYCLLFVCCDGGSGRVVEGRGRDQGDGSPPMLIKPPLMSPVDSASLIIS